MTRRTQFCLFGALCFGCATAEASRDDDPKQIGSSVSSLISADDDPSANGSSKAALENDDATLRRSYGAKDMQLHACVTAKDDGSIVGKQCPAGLVVFGPYVTVPSNADVRLRFDIESTGEVRFISDVLSQGAKRFHGALEEQLIHPKESRSVSYRIHVFDAVRALESRIGVRGDAPVDFKITNLSLQIE